MSGHIKDKQIAILATNGFEESELKKPLEALRNAGALPKIVSIETGTIRGWTDKNWGNPVSVDMSLATAKPEQFAALVLPGGVMNPDTLRMNVDAVKFVQHFVDEKKPIAAICHGASTLIETGGVAGRRVTSYPSIRTDLINAGAEWIDAEVVVDNGLVTSRSPRDLAAFCSKMLEEIAEGPHRW